MNLKSPNSKRFVLYSLRSTVLISLQVQQPQPLLLLISIILYSDQFCITITSIWTDFNQNGVKLIIQNSGSNMVDNASSSPVNNISRHHDITSIVKFYLCVRKNLDFIPPHFRFMATLRKFTWKINMTS